MLDLFKQLDGGKKESYKGHSDGGMKWICFPALTPSFCKVSNINYGQCSANWLQASNLYMKWLCTARDIRNLRHGIGEYSNKRPHRENCLNIHESRCNLVRSHKTGAKERLESRTEIQYAWWHCHPKRQSREWRGKTWRECLIWNLRLCLRRCLTLVSEPGGWQKNGW